MASTWETRELPVLRAVIDALERGKDPNTSARKAVADLPDNLYLEMIAGLHEDGYIVAPSMRNGSGKLVTVHIERLGLKGREVVRSSSRSAPVMDTQAVIDRLSGLSESQLESFFLARNLGAAFNSPGRGWGKRKKVNAALAGAEAEGRLTSILQDAVAHFTFENGAPERASEGEPITLQPVQRGAGVTQARVFISHATEDRELADKLVDLLQLGTDVGRKQVFCSSRRGTGIPAGSDFVRYIVEQMRDTVIVVQLVSPSFLASSFCMRELGAQWISEKDSFPLLVPPSDLDDVRTVLGVTQVERINDPAALDSLHDRIRAALHLNPDTAQWTRKRDDFLKMIAPSLSLRKHVRVDVPTPREVDELLKMVAKRTREDFNELFSVALQDVGVHVWTLEERADGSNHLRRRARDSTSSRTPSNRSEWPLSRGIVGECVRERSTVFRHLSSHEYAQCTPEEWAGRLAEGDDFCMGMSYDEFRSTDWFSVVSAAPIIDERSDTVRGCISLNVEKDVQDALERIHAANDDLKAFLQHAAWECLLVLKACGA